MAAGCCFYGFWLLLLLLPLLFLLLLLLFLVLVVVVSVSCCLGDGCLCGADRFANLQLEGMGRYWSDHFLGAMDSRCICRHRPETRYRKQDFTSISPQACCHYCRHELEYLIAEVYVQICYSRRPVILAALRPHIYVGLRGCPIISLLGQRCLGGLVMRSNQHILGFLYNFLCKGRSGPSTGQTAVSYNTCGIFVYMSFWTRAVYRYVIPRERVCGRGYVLGLFSGVGRGDARAHEGRGQWRLWAWSRLR